MMSTTSGNSSFSDDKFNVEKGIKAPSYSSPAPEGEEDEKSIAAAAVTPWKYWGFETGDIVSGWEWGKSQYQAGGTDRLVRSSSTHWLKVIILLKLQ
jgi:hypothetical protein